MEVSKHDPNTKFSKLLLDHEAFEKFARRKEPKKPANFWDKFLAILFKFCCCYVNKMTQLDTSNRIKVNGEDPERDDDEELNRLMEEAIK